LVESDPGEAGDDDVDLVNTAFAEQLWEVAGVGLHHFETGVLPGESRRKCGIDFDGEPASVCTQAALDETGENA
jgi:hypothetical protein